MENLGRRTARLLAGDHLSAARPPMARAWKSQTFEKGFGVNSEKKTVDWRTACDVERVGRRWQLPSGRMRTLSAAETEIVFERMSGQPWVRPAPGYSQNQRQVG